MNIMPAGADGKRFTGATTSLGIRPEHIDLASDDDAHCTGTVEVAEYLGADTYLYVNCAGLDTIVVRRTGAETVKHGETVGLKFNEPDIHLFNGEGRSVGAA